MWKPSPALALCLASALSAACTSNAASDGGVDATIAPEAALEAGPDAVPGDAAGDATDVAPVPPRRFLRDVQGRALIFHGVNVDSHAKSDPLRMPRFAEADAARFAEQWGFNLTRFLVFWDALEPSAGTIDGAYLDRVATRLDWFAAHGVSVILDMHQDVYAARFCCDGAPAWAIRDDGQPFALQDLWSLNYLQPAVQRAFDNFFAYEPPHRDLQDHYAAAWAALAARFRNHPAVLGYDLMNEPSSGSLFDPLEALRGVSSGPASSGARFDRERLGPFYQRVIDAIRAVDPDRWIFVEPRFAAPAAGALQYLPVLRDPRPGERRIAFAPHLYSAAYEGAMSYGAGDGTVARWESARAEETRAQDWPIVVGEFGMDQTFPGAQRYLDDVLGMSDRMLLSWCYWSWDPGTWGFWDPTTMRESGNIEQLVRVYPQRVAGQPRVVQWDRVARVFTLDFDSMPGVSAPTEVFVPEARFYPAGFAVELDDPAGSYTQSWDGARHVLSLTTDPSRASHHVVIRPM